MNELKVDIKEWEEIGPEKDTPLFHKFIEDENSRKTIKVLNDKGILNILELKDGLKITSNSYVGKIKIGDIQLNIRPKIEGMPLYKLLKYTYGLRDLKIFDEAIHDIDSFPFYDLLIYQMYVEIEDLVYRGLNKKYKKEDEDLKTPRGRININKLVNRTVASATLPCTYFERSEDNEMNRVLLAGLHLALDLTDDRSLKIRIHRLCNSMEESVNRIGLNRVVLLKTIKSVDRLSERYRPSLELINILFESQGIQLEDGKSYMKLNGFFFDMNMFFQSLLSKLLSNCLEGFIIRDEYKLHELFAYTPGFNPLGNSTPKPRPDFAVVKGNKVECLLDAKYRDLWQTKLPSSWLYQLSIYAISGIGNGTAKILYPSIAKEAKLQKIDVMKPTTGEKVAVVLVRPVSLLQIADYIDLPKKEKHKLQDYIKQVVFDGY